MPDLTIQDAQARLAHRPPGTALPWQEKVKELPQLTGNPDLVKKVWENTDALAYMYIWQILLSF